MRKPSKSSLAKGLDKILSKYDGAKSNNDDCSNISSDKDDVEKDDSCIESEEEEGNESLYLSPSSNGEKHVTDWGYLLRQAVWDRDSSFREIIQKYLTYVGSRYGNCTCF